MNRHQATIGAAVAAALVLGANASSLEGPQAPSLAMQVTMPGERIASIVARACGGALAPHATALTALATCGNRAFGEALDVFGELAARLKEL